MIIPDLLKSRGYVDKGDYWQFENTYIQYDDVVLRITVGPNHEDIPVNFLRTYPTQLDSHIKAVGGML